MAKGDRITAQRFNDLRAKVLRTMGTGTGTEGYGQALLSTPVIPGQQLSSTTFNNLRTDAAKAYAHQTNASVVNTAASDGNAASLLPPNLELVTTQTQISNALLTQYDNFANNILANRAAAAAGQLTSATITTTQRSTAWNGVISHTVTLTFGGYTQGSLTVSAADHIRVFFNAGGRLTVSASRTGGTANTKNTTWSNMLSGFGTLSIGASNTTITGAVNSPGSTNSAVSFASLGIGAAAQTLMTQVGPTGVYSDNSYIIQISRPTTNTMTFTIIFRDDDIGNRPPVGPPPFGPPPFGPLVDENIDGILTSIVGSTRPFGSNVDVPAPSGAATGL